jgi:hypothetical protein
MKNWKRISLTFLARSFGAAVGLLNLLITSHEMGAEARAVLALFTLCTAAVALVSEWVVGPALVVEAARFSPRRLWLTGYGWILASASACALLFGAWGLLPGGFAFQLWIITILQGMATFHQQWLIAKGRLMHTHLLLVVQNALQIGLLAWFCFGMGWNDIEAYMISLMVGFGAMALLTALSLSLGSDALPLSPEPFPLKRLLRVGGWVTLANLAHLAATRITFYLLNRTVTKAELGCYTTAVTLTESVLLVSTSISLVLYAQLAVNSGQARARRMATYRMTGWGAWGAALGLLLLLAIPSELWEHLLGKSFNGISTLMRYYAPSVWLLALTTIISHYFSGSGRFHICAAGSGVALVVNLLGAWCLIPILRENGALLASALAFFAQLIFLVHRLHAEEARPLRVWLPELFRFHHPFKT